MAAVESNYNASEMLTEVNNAIYAVLVGGQSYKIGTRQLTRADLSLLYKVKERPHSADCSRGFNQFTG